MKRLMMTLCAALAGAFALSTRGEGLVPVEPYEYVAPVYKEIGGVSSPTNGIDHWTTNKNYGCTAVTNAAASVTWNAGWYVVTNDVKITRGVIVNGEVNLILGDGASLWVTNETAYRAGIVVNEGNTFAIYGQKDGTGKLDVFGNMYAAAIGSDKNTDSGAITVNGGVVTATGAQQGAGIGGGDGARGTGISPQGGKGQNITLNGGSVTATGGWAAAGIGGSAYGTGENITVNGGTVTAAGGQYGAGIGGGAYGTTANITINGGNVAAKGGVYGAGIGGGREADGCGITINGGTVTAQNGPCCAGIGGGWKAVGKSIAINGGSVTAIGSYSGIAGIGSSEQATAQSSDIFIGSHMALKASNEAEKMWPVTYTALADVTTKIAGKRYVTIEPGSFAIDDAGFTTLGEAVWSARDGDTVTLLGNVSNASVQIAANKFPSGATLDLAGYTLTFDKQGGVEDGLSIWSNNVFTVKNGTLATTTEAGLRDLIRFYGTKLTLDEITLDGTNIPAGLTTKANAVITVENGTCSAEGSTIIAPTGVADNTLYAIKFGNHSHREYTMGTLSVKRSMVTGDLLINGGSYDEADTQVSGRYFYGRNIHSVWESACDAFVARTGVLPETGAEDNFVGQLYKSFTDALAAAQATEGGDTVTLLQDVVNSQDITLDTPTVINAAGHTYTSTGSLTLDVTKAAATPFIKLGEGSSCSAGLVTCIGKEGYEAVTDAQGNLIYGLPKVQLGVVAQRYPWNGILDVNYKAEYTPAGVYKLKLKVELEGVEKEKTYFEPEGITAGIGSVAFDLREVFGEVKGKAKVTATLEKMDD